MSELAIEIINKLIEENEKCISNSNNNLKSLLNQIDYLKICLKKNEFDYLFENRSLKELLVLKYKYKEELNILLKED